MEIRNEQKVSSKVPKRSTCLILEMHGITPKTNNWLFRYIITDMDKSSATALG